MNKNIAIIFVLVLGLIFQLRNAAAQINGEKIEDIPSFCSNLKGFNLLGKFDKNWTNRGFNESEFKLIHDLGFNFARLPVDYRTYTLANNWNYFVDSWVKNIDDAIAWGEKYDVHVCLNLHHAPGYCVNTKTGLPTDQQRNLWTDSVAQRVFVNHWRFFADRYKDISPKVLSFNLVNEPNSEVSKANYLKVMKMAIDTIHQITQDRLIFVDGLNFAHDILVALKDEPNVAQAIHSYQPFRLTHYKAGWVNGSDTWPLPQWPVLAVNNHLYGPWKSEFKSPLIFLSEFPAGTKVVVNVQQVSIESTLQIIADNKTIYSKEFLCSANPGNDFTEVVQTQWGFQNISNKDFFTVLEDSASSISFENSKGDWMTINSISFINDKDSLIYHLGDSSWGLKQATYQINGQGKLKTQEGEDLSPFMDYKDNFEIALANNIPFMVQEFGVYNQTPHTTTISFLSDLMDFFIENRVGWALWNLDGSFGIINSGRSDCNYEPFNGQQLDKKMLDILLKSAPTSAIEIDTGENLKIYPNPAKNELYISGNQWEGETWVKITDISGRMIKSIKCYPEKSGLMKLDVSTLNPDLHLISVINKGKIITRKVMIL